MAGVDTHLVSDCFASLRIHLHSIYRSFFGHGRWLRLRKAIQYRAWIRSHREMFMQDSLDILLSRSSVGESGFVITPVPHCEPLQFLALGREVGCQDGLGENCRHLNLHGSMSLCSCSDTGLYRQVL